MGLTSPSQPALFIKTTSSTSPFIENLKSIFENYWKSKNQINTSVKLPIKISIDNQNNSKISDLSG